MPKRSRPRLAVGAALALVAAGLSTALGAPAGADDPAPPTTLTLVTLAGPGTAATPGRLDQTATLLAQQDAVLARIGAPAPTYRWTTALNGFAVPLTTDQADALAADPGVALVEPDEIRRLTAGAPSAADLGRVQRPRGGAGVVIGIVDSGITPDVPVLAAVPGLGRDPEAFRGGCVEGAEGSGWSATTCNRKLVAASFFVSGFGADRLRSTESLSPRDTLGHGTQVASVAAGNAGVSVRVGDRRAGRFGGVAPQARVAAYKACWTAPDPEDDGCSTADVVSAIDRATADGVDVLNLAIDGPAEIDTVERALLGAAEADVVVVAAAGNSGRSAYAAHTSPWVTTVGAVDGGGHRAVLDLRGGPTLVGAGRPGRATARARIVPGAELAAAGARRADARRCLAGSLDAARTAGAVVVCARGGTGRVDKSAAVAAADGRAMVLVNVRRGAVSDDFHAVPTVHLAVDEARTLERWLRRHGDARAGVRPLGATRQSARVPRWTPQGDPTLGVLKPDLVGPATGVLGAVPTARRWALYSGTSAAAAQVSGQAALLRSRHDWSAPVVRSALVTTSSALPAGNPLQRGAGRLSEGAVRVGLALEVDEADYRRTLEGTLSLRDLNTPTVLVTGRRRTVTREVTNLGRRAEYFSVSTRGFARHDVTVRPLAVRLGPGETATFTLTVRGPEPTRLDAGTVVWSGARGSLTRLPVVIAR